MYTTLPSLLLLLLLPPFTPTHALDTPPPPLPQNKSPTSSPHSSLELAIFHPNLSLNADPNFSDVQKLTKYTQSFCSLYVEPHKFTQYHPRITNKYRMKNIGSLMITVDLTVDTAGCVNDVGHIGQEKCASFLQQIHAGCGFRPSRVPEGYANVIWFGGGDFNYGCVNLSSRFQQQTVSYGPTPLVKP